MQLNKLNNLIEITEEFSLLRYHTYSTGSKLTVMSHMAKENS